MPSENRVLNDRIEEVVNDLRDAIRLAAEPASDVVITVADRKWVLVVPATSTEDQPEYTEADAFFDGELAREVQTWKN